MRKDSHGRLSMIADFSFIGKYSRPTDFPRRRRAAVLAGEIVDCGGGFGGDCGCGCVADVLSLAE